MASDKTAVIEYLWHTLSAEGRDVVTFDDLSKAIHHFRDTAEMRLSANNPANFLKDLLRGSNPSKNWPVSLAEQGITGRQLKGKGRVFQFVPYTDGQTEPFPNPFDAIIDTSPLTLQSVSLPLVTKTLGRVDESWLIQVAVHLRILEAHFVNRSVLEVVELSHLQVGVKLGKSEIDSLYLAVLKIEGELVRALVTCEAKQANDPIIADQIVQQVVAAFRSVERKLDIELIIPIAIKAVANEGAIKVFEFEPWTLGDATMAEDHLKSLVLSASGLYKLKPPVPGIGFVERTAKK